MAKRKEPYKSKSSFNPLSFIFLAGIFLIVFAGLIKIGEMRNLSYAGNLPASAFQNRTSFAQRILIPDSGIDLTVSETNIVKNNWQIYAKGASHLQTSANPGEKGNVIIYGHNTLNRFGYLYKVKKGSLVNVYTKDGKDHEYKVVSIATVNPSNTTPLLPTSKEELTLYTCTGFADLQRLVIQAEPVI